MKPFNIYSIADPSYNIRANTFKIHKGQTLSHSLSIFLTMWEQIQNGNDVYSELIFSTGDRCDVFVPNMGAIEIIHSEGKESVERKKENYPVDVIFLESDKVIKYWLDKLN